jgi:hypothetical protein
LAATRSADGIWCSSDPEHSARPLDALTLAAVGYLALPLLVFCAGWLKWPYAIAACLLALVAIAAALPPRGIARRAPLSRATLLLIGLAGFAWAAFGGAGHIFYANSDWVVRDAVLMDLVHAAWPPSYAEQGGDPVILRTTLGYFLPAAALGALFGAGTADAFLYAWTGLGAALFLLLLPLPQGRMRLAVALGVVVLFSGMDAAGVMFIAGSLPAPPLHLEWWAHPLQYSSHTTQLFWVPNHALPAWIAAAMFYRHWRNDAFWPPAILVAALLPLWTPFAAIGIAPYVALVAADRLGRGLGLRLPLALLGPAILLLGLQARYLGLDFATLGASTPDLVVFDAGKSLFRYARFALLEFALLAAVLYVLLRHSRGLCALAFGVLAALPLVISFGPSNDIVMRASIPSLAMLAILSIRALDESRGAAGGIPRALLIVFLAVGAVTPAYEFWRALARPRWTPSIERTLLDVTRGQLPPHYVGRLDRGDLKAILRPPALVAPRRKP